VTKPRKTLVELKKNVLGEVFRPFGNFTKNRVFYTFLNNGPYAAFSIYPESEQKTLQDFFYFLTREKSVDILWENLGRVAFGLFRKKIIFSYIF
jgi:hypothetical protein